MSDKAIIPYNQPKKGIKVHDKRKVITIGLSIDESDKKDYFKNRIKELEEANRKLKDAINSLSNRRDEIKYLKQFRALFTGHCIVTNVQLTILQCTDNIRKGKCKMPFICKTRLAILDGIDIKNLNT